ncbi:hypothetical protein M0R04_12695 [Candidatus Dojkabacteria bacterium]|jgi:hypothetical protein|nr:hypothetical protein [Candidatus Dojkabacteria bacterium]
MRIEIKENKILLVALTDENLDNDNYVGLDFDERIVEVHIDELLCAVHAFEQKRLMRINRENNYRDN